MLDEIYDFWNPTGGDLILSAGWYGNNGEVRRSSPNPCRMRLHDKYRHAHPVAGFRATASQIEYWFANADNTECNHETFDVDIQTGPAATYTDLWFQRPDKVKREEIPQEWSAFKGFTGELLAKYNRLGLSYETLYACWQREQSKRGVKLDK